MSMVLISFEGSERSLNLILRHRSVSSKTQILTHEWEAQCDQIGRFLEFLGNQINKKSSPSVWWLYWHLWKRLLFKSHWCAATFWATFWKPWATFYSIIWSHWREEETILDLFFQKDLKIMSNAIGDFKL